MTRTRCCPSNGCLNPVEVPWYKRDKFCPRCEAGVQEIVAQIVSLSLRKQYEVWRRVKKAVRAIKAEQLREQDRAQDELWYR